MRRRGLRNCCSRLWRPDEQDHAEEQGEERFPAIGVTKNGRWLVVIVTERGLLARVVTAFEADKNLIALYLKSKWGTL